MILNSRGLSLVEVLMSIGILSIVVLGVMELNRGNANSSVNSSSNLDYVQLVSEFLIVIEDEGHCRSSLADPAADPLTIPQYGAEQITFNASQVRSGTDPVNHPEIEIWSGDPSQNYLRSRRRFAAGESYGNITIDSVKLHLPDHLLNTDFLVDTSMQAEIVLRGTKRITTDQTREIKPIFKTVYINTTADGSGLSYITGCDRGIP